MVKSFKLRVPTPRKHLAFGTVKVYARELAEGETLDVKVEPIVRDPDYKHPGKLWGMSTKLAAQCAVDRAEDLIEQIKVDELEESGHFAKETAGISRGEPETQSAALSGKAGANGLSTQAVRSTSCLSAIWEKETDVEPIR